MLNRSEFLMDDIAQYFPFFFSFFLFGESNWFVFVRIFNGPKVPA